MKHSNEQLIESLKENCRVNFGKPLHELIADLKQSEDFIKYGSSSIKPFTKCGHYIMITSNTNFAGGIKNGYGAGAYAILRFTGFSNELKLCEI